MRGHNYGNYPFCDYDSEDDGDDGIFFVDNEEYYD
jgi:hypothetical protein